MKVETKRRWMNWAPKTEISVDSARHKPTKPAKPSQIFPLNPKTVPSKPAIAVAGFVDEDRGVPWADWEAAALKRLFIEIGSSRQTSHITAVTVRHGESQRQSIEDRSEQKGAI